MPDETKPDLPETTEDAVNPALDVVTDLILDSTIPAPIRRNAFKAFGQLCTAAIEWPVAYFEGKAAEVRAGTKARIKIIKENADQIAQQLNVNPEYVRRAGNKFAQKIIREQLNLDKISTITANELKNGEPDSLTTNLDTTGTNEGQFANSTNQDTNGSEKKTIDDDWLNNFETQARQVSTEDMQLRFGRVLAGEIHKPGSYSIRTVKILRELDQDVAALFKKLCSMCIAFESQVDSSVLDARVLTLGKSLREGNYGEYHLSNYELDVLIEYGLVDFLENVYLYPYNLCVESLNNLAPQSFLYQGQKWIFVPLDPIQKFRLNGFSCTRAGRELYRIIDQEPMPEYTEELTEYFMKQNLAMRSKTSL